MAVISSQTEEDAPSDTSPDLAPEEAVAEASLRPQQLNEYVGQEQLKKNLTVLIAAARTRGEPVEHLLFYGPPGLGKTTLAHIIARETGVNIRVTSGPAIERAGDLAALLTNLATGDILFIDEIHRLSKVVEEVLYPAMEDGVLDIVIGKGPGARSIRMELPKFTLIGATTRIGMIASPLRDRFGATYRLEYYTEDELSSIVTRSAGVLGVELEAAAASELAARSRFTPRIINRLLRRSRDYAQVHGRGTITLDAAHAALDLLEVDSKGLDRSDRRILETIITRFGGGPVGLSTLAASTGEEEDTITDVHEPFLMRLGMIARTPKGRTVTAAGYDHLGLARPENSQQTIL